MATEITDHYGHRARIGVIYMSSSTVLEAEFQAMAPDGVSFHVDRLTLPTVSIDGLDRMMGADQVEGCVRELAQAPLHVILFGGTSATFLNGIAWDRGVIERMESVSGGIPATTTSTAVLAGLRAVGARRVAVAAPYTEDITARGADFLRAGGFEVTSQSSMGIDEDHAIGAVPTADVHRFVRDHAAGDFDAVFISCTNLRTVGAIARLEEDLGVPVVSAIQASFWLSLRLAGVADRVPGFGRLFDRQHGQQEWQTAADHRATSS